MTIEERMIQALQEQDLETVRQCLEAPGFDPNGIVNSRGLPVPLAKPTVWLSLAIQVPLAGSDHADPRAAIARRQELAQNRIAIVKTLLDAGADPNAMSQPNSMSPLFLAICELGDTAFDAVKLLLAAGANPNYYTPLRRTPLHLACLPNRVCARNGLDLVRALLDAGANPNARDDMKKTPLHWAMGADYNHEILMVLHEAGAKWNLHDNTGRTPLDHLSNLHPERASWWEAYPGFQALKRTVQSVPDSQPIRPRRM